MPDEHELGMMVAGLEIAPDILAQATDVVTDQMQQGLAVILETTQSELPSYQGGGWEIVSHTLTRLDSHLIVTFLLRRPRQRTGRNGQGGTRRIDLSQRAPRRRN